MSKGFVQPGDVVPVIAPYAVASGAGVKAGSLFGFAQTAAALNASVEIAVRGVHSGIKAGTQAWTLGLKIYWDDAAKNLTSVPTANIMVGVAVAPLPGAGAGETTGTILLSGPGTA